MASFLLPLYPSESMSKSCGINPCQSQWEWATTIQNGGSSATMLTIEKMKVSSPQVAEAEPPTGPRMHSVFHHGALKNVHYLLGKQSSKWERYSTPLLSYPCSHDVRSRFPQDTKETPSGTHTDRERGGKSLHIMSWVTDVSRTVVSRVTSWSHLRGGWHFFSLSAQDLQRWTFPEHMFSFEENRSDGNWQEPTALST